MPVEERPWGAITGLAETFSLSRVSVYALGKRLQARLGVGSTGAAVVETREAKPELLAAERANVLERTVLTATFPGDVSIRATQAILEEALGENRSVGWISELRLAAGRQAGQVLQQIDMSALGPLIAIRDETFFQGEPILLVVDPVSLTILLAQACDDRQAETRGVALRPGAGCDDYGVGRRYGESLSQVAAPRGDGGGGCPERAVASTTGGQLGAPEPGKSRLSRHDQRSQAGKAPEQSMG